MPGAFRRLLLFTLLAAILLSAQTEDRYNSNQRILRIRELGKRGPTALPTLAQYLADPDRDIRIETVKAVVRIDTGMAVSEIAVGIPLCVVPPARSRTGAY